MKDYLTILSSNEISIQILIIISVSVFLLFIKNRVISFLTGISKKTSTEYDDVILESINTPFTYFIILYSIFIVFEKINDVYQYYTEYSASSLFYSLLVIFVSFSIVRFLDRYYNKKLYLKNIEDNIDPVAIEQTYEISIRVMKIFIIVMAILILMQEYGLSISGLLAFGGVGGLVVGLAAKDLLSNFFGGLMIFFDRPFKVGEFIKSPDRNIEGIVESIGWRLTVVRTFSKNVLYIPNSAFSNIIVENATRMTNRRINEVIGLRYEDLSKIPAIVSQIRHYLESHNDIDQNMPPVVYFSSFEASSCDIIVYAFTNTKEWREFLSVKEDILYKISSIIESNNAAIAFPTTTIDWDKQI